jgi:hypothetical protein
MKKVISLILLFLAAISISYAIGRRDMYDASDFLLDGDGGKIYVIWYKGEPYQYEPSLKY